MEVNRQTPEQAAAELYDVSVRDWAQGDMRTLDLGRTFGLIIVPGHSFQFMFTPEDQARTGFKERVVSGDFFTKPLGEKGSELVWAAEKP